MGRNGQRLHRQAFQAFQVGVGQQRALGVDLVQPFQLDQRDGGIDAGQVVLESRLHDLRLGLAAMGQAVVSVDTEAMEPEHAYLRGQGFIVGHEHRAFGTGHMFLMAWNEKIAVPRAPTWRPLYRVPAAWAASSITVMPCLSASAYNGSRSNERRRNARE